MSMNKLSMESKGKDGDFCYKKFLQKLQDHRPMHMCMPIIVIMPIVSVSGMSMNKLSMESKGDFCYIHSLA